MKVLATAALIALVLPLHALHAQEQNAKKMQEDMLIQQIQSSSEKLMNEGLSQTQTPPQAPATAEQTQLQPPATEPEAQDAIEVIEPKDLTHKYSPDYCEFETSFPEEPYIENKCDGGEDRNKCYDLVSYTQTFALDATVTMRVVCNKIGQDIKDKYDETVMIKTLEAMTKEKVVQQFSTSYREDEDGNYRLAGLVGEGKLGMIPSIFIAQMWLGKNSAMTIEAELVGEQFNESDALFRDLLRGVSYKDAVNTPVVPAEKAAE
jgi:hypothetical protein